MQANRELQSQLGTGLQEMGVALSGAQQAQLLVYLDLLSKWNKTYNLTAITVAEQMVSLHLLDSLSLLPYLQGDRILDVGSGAGLPGIPLAIAEPQRHFVLLDSNNKKTRFLQQIIYQLGLDNVQVVHSRVEDYQVDVGFSTITSRAFSALVEMLTLTAPLCAPAGIFLAMKGIYPEQELADIPAKFAVQSSHSLTVPGVEGSRHVICIKRCLKK